MTAAVHPKAARRLRILMICPQFLPIVGGYERAAERLSGELVRQGSSVVVVTERRDALWPASEQRNGFAIRRVWCRYRRGLHMVTSLLSYGLFLVRHGRSFDIWHVHQYGAHATLAVLLGSLLGRPVVLKLTSSERQGIEAAIASIRLGCLHAWAHRRVDGCIAVSDETEQEARHFGFRSERIVQIGNGVDTGTFQPATEEVRQRLRAQLGLPERPTAIFVGRLAEEKNPLCLLNAWRLAQPRLRMPWTLVLVGDGPLRQSVEQWVRAHDLEDSVFMAGVSEHVERWLRASDVFVLSSHHEGMANTALEAMACGLPLIATAVSGIDELVVRAKTGRVVPVNDSRAFASALVELHAAPAVRAEMGARAREVIVQGYSIQVIAARHVTLYRGLLSQ